MVVVKIISSSRFFKEKAVATTQHASSWLVKAYIYFRYTHHNIISLQRVVDVTLEKRLCQEIFTHRRRHYTRKPKLLLLYTSINCDKIDDDDDDDDDTCMCVCVLLRVNKVKYYKTQRRKQPYNIIPAAFKASFTHCGISPFSF